MNVYTAFEQTALNFPHKTAIEYGEEHVPYRLLLEHTEGLSQALLALGQGKNSLTGVVLSSSPNLVVSLLAILSSGSLFVPVDARFPARRLQQMFDQTPCRVLITDEAHLEKVSAIARDHNPETEWIIVINKNGFDILRSAGEGFEKTVFPPPTTASATAPGDEDSCYIFYTSGSTGIPKPIEGMHKSLEHFIRWEREEFAIDETHKVSQLAQFTFDASLRDILLPLTSGATLCIPPAGIKENMSLLASWLENSGVTLIHSVPTLFRLLTRELASQAATGERFPDLKHFLLSGEPLFGKDLINWQQACEDHTELVNLYGPSETTMIRTFHRITEIPAAPSQPVHAGKPIANSFVLILNARNELCKVGEKGDIYIRTPYMTKGYYGNKELTEKAFVQNPLAKDFEDIIYRTGDLGRYLKDRSVEILGRVDDQVKINGVRIETEEVRKAVIDLKGIDDACVVAHTGSDNLSELACYYLGDAFSPDSLKEKLAEALADAMLPSYFIHMDAFPVNANGKVDKHALPKPGEALLKAVTYEAPATETEEKLETIWQEVLGISPIGRKASFFALGGSSLKATQLVTRLYKTFRVTVSLREIFEHSTIAELGRLIDGMESTEIGRILNVATQDHYPVSDGQRRLYVLTQFEGNVSAYNMPGVYHFSGNLDKDALFRAFDTLIERHEILRTVFDTVDGELRQFVLPAHKSGFRPEFTDLRSETAPVKHAEMVADKKAIASFDLQNGPLLRAKLMQVGEERYIMAFNMHHIISDGWTMEVLIREVMSIYSAYSQGIEYEAEPPSLQYKDYAAWQQARLQGENLEAYRHYWSNKLTGSLPVLELPTDKPRPAVKTYNGASLEYTFDKSLTRQLQEWSSSREASLHMAILTSVYALFYKYTGQKDIILGTPSAGRVHKDLEDQLGFYVNLLALRTTFEGNDTFEQLLDKVKDTTLGAYEHQVYPFDRLVEEFNTGRQLSRSPLFDVAVILHNTSVKEDNLPLPGNLQVSRAEPGVTVSKYDMQLNFYLLDEKLHLNLEYNTDLFRDDRINTMMQHLQAMIKEMVTGSAPSIGAADYLSQEEKQQLLYNWNDTHLPYSRKKTMHRLFEEQVVQCPGQVALVCGEEHLTYAQLNERANRLARYLVDKGVQNSQNIAIMTGRTSDMIIGMYGILKANAAYVPIDPAYPADRQLYICENSEVTFILSDKPYEVISQLPDEVEHILLDEHTGEAYDSTNPDLTKDTTELAYTIYTSGSTGRPKGVMIEHHSAVNLIEWVNNTYQVGRNDRQLFITSMCFDLSVYDIFGTLAAGGTVVMASQEEVRDAYKLKELMQRYRITFWDSVPTTMNHLIAGLEDAGEAYVQNDLRVVFMSGDWIPVDLPARIKKFYPNAQVISLGGATEGTVWSNWYPVEGEHTHWSSIPYGRPITNNYFYILDEHLNPVPQGVPGELFIGGTGVARGYANDPVKTAASFMKDPFSNRLGGRMYRTGDLGRMSDDWQMEFLGRKDHQVKIRGFRVEIGEVNTSLARHTDIKEAIVVAKGERNNIFLAAYYTSEKILDAATLREYMGSTLPDYMIPAYFIQLDQLPLNANGKVDHKQLPEPDTTTLQAEIALPQTETQERLAAIWKDILGNDHFGIKDDFFTIGGHSLSAMRVLSWIQKEFGVRMDLRAMFLNPTISAMAEAIEESVGEATQTISKAAYREFYPLSHAQKRLWITHQMEDDQIAFNIPLALNIHGPLDKIAFSRAFDDIVARHESLRTVFITREGQTFQQILEATELGFSVGMTDLGPDPDARKKAAAMAEAEVNTPFDLEKGPLVRVKLITIGEEEHLLLLTIHHIISDAWSLGIMVKELMAAYQDYKKGQKPVFKPLTIQYKDFVYWHNSQITGETGQKHKN
ncbi:MAG: amino acid adenylation domain-containing protein, partial [Cyclobacteriaceae bacterium]